MRTQRRDHRFTQVLQKNFHSFISIFPTFFIPCCFNCRLSQKLHFCTMFPFPSCFLQQRFSRFVFKCRYLFVAFGRWTLVHVGARLRSGLYKKGAFNIKTSPQAKRHKPSLLFTSFITMQLSSQDNFHH